MPRLTVLICTHNRVELLTNAISSLNAATRPEGWQVGLLVAANACSDGTIGVTSCMMIDAVMYGMIPSAKMDSCSSAPPLNRLTSP